MGNILQTIGNRDDLISVPRLCTSWTNCPTASVKHFPFFSDLKKSFVPGFLMYL